MNDKKSYIEKCVLAVVIFLLLAVLLHSLGGTQLQYKSLREEQFQNNSSVGELLESTEVRQDFISNLDSLTAVSLCFSTYERNMEGFLTLDLIQSEQNILLSSIQLQASTLPAGGWHDIVFPEEITDIKGKKLSLVITGHSPQNAAPTLYRTDYELIPNRTLYLNGNPIDGELSIVLIGKHYFSYYAYYWHTVLILEILFILYLIFTYQRIQQGKTNLAITLYQLWKRYRFLIKQLVARDFKTKYKRSVLGYIWSFLNPLMTMLVQYAVFSTIFRTDIQNFPVYLLSGTVFFSFFTESVSQGLTAIVGNASLITKVYVPKYIYPITKVFSCAVNLLISLIPLLLLALFTKAPLRFTLVLLIIPLCSILIFSMGMALLLSTAMVFFRDTQYLWSIASLVLSYATPLFYPISILPEELRSILYWNPLYYMISFVRSILIEGVSPEPLFYFGSLGSAAITFLIGIVVFKKYQRKFALYI